MSFSWRQSSLSSREGNQELTARARAIHPMPMGPERSSLAAIRRNRRKEQHRLPCASILWRSGLSMNRPVRCPPFRVSGRRGTLKRGHQTGRSVCARSLVSMRFQKERAAFRRPGKPQGVLKSQEPVSGQSACSAFRVTIGPRHLADDRRRGSLQTGFHSDSLRSFVCLTASGAGRSPAGLAGDASVAASSSGKTTMAMRRLLARPSGVSLSATG